MPYKILFVCLGNICRSPAAENIMNHLLEKESLGEAIVCDSCGTGGYHVGSPPDDRMTAAASKRGIAMKGSARKFSQEDFEKFDLILTMDRQNYWDVLARDERRQYEGKVKMICDYCTDREAREVPDPYYGGPSGFDRVIDLLTDACSNVLKETRKTLGV